MRTNTISSLAFVASSLLVKDVIAGVVHNHARLHKRENYMVMIEEEVQVTRLADGSFRTGLPAPVHTSTVLIEPSTAAVVAATPAPVVASSSPEEVAVPSSSSSSIPAAIFVEEAKPTTSAAPVVAAPEPSTSSVAPIVQAPEPVTTSAAPVVQAPPTTFATSKSSAPSSTPVSSPATSGGKRGVAFNDNSVLSAFSGKASWCYNWGQFEGTIPSGFEYVPMLWGNKAGFYDSWSSNANSAISSGSTHLLAFNEPDLPEQSNMDVATAVADFKTHMQPFAGKAKLGAPSVTNGGAPMGLTYLGNFMTACSDCTIDFIPVHWYNGDALDSSIAYFKSHVDEAHTTG
jgi:hypothetical protein